MNRTSGVKREETRAFDARYEEHFVGGAPQCVQEILVVDVAFALPAQVHQHAIRPREHAEVLGERLHVFMLERDHLEEAGVQFQMRTRVGEPDRDKEEEPE